MQTNDERIIVALDRADLKSAETLIHQLKEKISYFKVGLELFTSQGWAAVDLVKRLGGKVFLDLKLHDIPNTVRKSVRTVCERDIDMVNVHALGGSEMMKAAAEEAKKTAAQHGNTSLKIIAVTILTSHTENQLSSELGIQRPLNDQVVALSKLAQASGLDGVVCSPREITLIRRNSGPDFCIVTPGIRMPEAEKGDQKRVCTPREALDAGSSYIVVGRPITDADDPGAAAESMIRSLH